MKKIIYFSIITTLFVACSNYGDKEKSGNIEVFYKDGISNTQAKHTADLFYASLKSVSKDTSARRSFQLMKGNGDTINLKMVVAEEKIAKASDEMFYAISYLISDSVFGGKPVNLILTDNKFNPKKTFAFKPITFPDISNTEKSFVSSGKIGLYYSNQIDTAVAQNLAGYLESYMQPEANASFYILKNDKNEFVLKMVTKIEAVNTLSANDIAEVAESISKNALNGSPLIYELSDTVFNTIRSFPITPANN